MNARFWLWYNTHVAARWWASSAMWVGIAAGAVEYVPDLLQMGLDQLDLLSEVFLIEDKWKRRIQGVLLFVVLPIAKAWRQKSMQKAQIKQAAELGKVVPLPASGVAPIVKAAPNVEP